MVPPPLSLKKERGTELNKMEEQNGYSHMGAAKDYPTTKKVNIKNSVKC